ncbi:hypothetical protein C8Q70DRAFT_1163726 [Cubamyces menziesii]|nr:hypothetical protein C8Q70DRAFT_1163726 [Cubamyces menziesii]
MNTLRFSIRRKFPASSLYPDSTKRPMSIRADKLLISVMQLLDIVEVYGYKVKHSILPWYVLWVMSASPHLDVAMSLAMRNSAFIENCCALATISFLLYDYLLTLDMEVKFFWRQPLSAASVLFYLNRYLTLTVYILVAIEFSQVLPQAWFSFLRVYAISNRNMTLAVTVFLLGMAPFGFNMIQLSSAMTTEDNQLLGGCVSSLHFTQLQIVTFTALSRGCLITSDLMAVLVTWRYTYMWYSMGTLVQTNKSLSFLLLSNGTICFLVLLLMNVLHLVATVASVSPLDNVVDHISYVGEFISPVTSVLISHFLFDLRTVIVHSSRGERLGTGMGPDTSEFATFVYSQGISFLGPETTLETAEEDHVFEGEILEPRY